MTDDRTPDLDTERLGPPPSSADLDTEKPGPLKPGGSSPSIAVATYTPPNETPDSMTRKWVSYLLLGLMTAVVVASFVELFKINDVAVPMLSNQSEAAVAVAADTAADADRLMRLMNLVFGPVVTLFSSVVGFYFGARTARESGSA